MYIYIHIHKGHFDTQYALYTHTQNGILFSLKEGNSAISDMTGTTTLTIRKHKIAWRAPWTNTNPPPG